MVEFVYFKEFIVIESGEVVDVDLTSLRGGISSESWEGVSVGL